MRKSGLLLPVFSLPSRMGIGCFSKEAYEFIDRLSAAGQSYWQVLPLGHAGGWYSPYQPLSCFALDPMYIDPYILYEEGTLCSSAMTMLGLESKHTSESRIDYESLLPARMEIYKNAFETWQLIGTDEDEFDKFCRKNKKWLEDYAMFIALRDKFGNADWSNWDKPFRFREKAALKRFSRENADEILFHKWLQYKAYSQWHNVINYAHSKGIEIIGDIPIYAAFESADCWAHPELFKLTKGLKPGSYSGCPPDAFSPDGQVWGNPLYKWRAHKDSGYSWWIERLKNNFKIYDVIRLDHFRGFESFYAVPKTAVNGLDGKWMRGPGMDFFKKVKSAIPKGHFIAEDLGYITPEVARLKERTGLPGMKVLQFAFDGNEANPYLPANYEEDCVVYTGTHDNDTTRGWYHGLGSDVRRNVTRFIRAQNGRQDDADKAPEFNSKSAAISLVSIAMRSKARTCIIPLQDYMLLGSEARVNTPGTTGDNWRWRMYADSFDDNLAEYILQLTRETGRIGAKNER
ncbi:MAG: 4-alpha-glucanotransferase [Firmicutes bacterium]|nr:4-alpha-glucanotransferase [Bacillota bacterium]